MNVTPRIQLLKECKFFWSETCRNYCWLGTMSTMYAVKVISVRVQKCSDSKNGRTASVLELLKVIGQHMEYAGLNVMWVESDLLGENNTEHVMAGNDYAKANGHMLTKTLALKYIVTTASATTNDLSSRTR